MNDAVLGVLNSNSGGGLKFGVGGTGFLSSPVLAGGGGGGGIFPPLKSPARCLFDGPKNSSCNCLMASSGSVKNEMQNTHYVSNSILPVNQTSHSLGPIILKLISNIFSASLPKFAFTLLDIIILVLFEGAS